VTKRNNSILIGWQGIILAIAIIGVGLLEPAYCQTDGVALLLQQTPVQGGTISPGIGIHRFAINTDVTLTAVPRPSYQFVYWLGDVSDPTANNTTTYLDGPKIIIAVFERVKYELLAAEERSQSTPGGGLRPSAGDYARSGGGGGGPGRKPHKQRPQPQPQPPEELEELPVPERGDDFPVPIPEPATGILLVLGSLFAFTGRGPKKQPVRNLSEETVYKKIETGVGGEGIFVK